MLEHHPHVFLNAAVQLHFSAFGTLDIGLSAKVNGPSGDVFETHHAAQQGGFPTAGWADQNQTIGGAHLQVEAVKDGIQPVAFDQTVHLNKGHAALHLLCVLQLGHAALPVAARHRKPVVLGGY